MSVRVGVISGSTRPVVAGKQLDRRGGDSFYRLIRLLAVLLRKKIGQKRDVALPIPQSRNMYWKHV